ncbi:MULTISPECIES: aminotransferase class I/II-fold pyridoxal phosphate-dependent enzyme [unclassified Rubrivivax]|uniref:aminotransferase class I/II-fold pyridoxal phosphate-dependent enzyme n=1 Tax=unclassified Rubrivivax TaxID=2649762 RepID=UPI001E58C4A3|nr:MULTISPECIES: aminotransferase class I/II-fold pyridoxal phosphate-dependent enzyme [unclassified Rubrivivax]MCC9597718.1 aminotransferase class I/II-fold pyridoxal phosphate-dependent enzyme [Rubrivivax sp. JA1055]MCC9646024.1 aminotransferase class I/II-fold pyridoxal phosphate-dependent enzyme [Rubrivivax sp. JA1029]
MDRLRTLPEPDRVHGGPDRHGPAPWDFSTCANAVGPCPAAVSALQRVDPTRYPDPGYHALRERLADWHRVEPARIVLAASASEFIQRVTVVGARLAPGAVALPAHAYGDYAAAARAAGRGVTTGSDATLRWIGEPSSPLGQDAPPPRDLARVPTVLDSVYAPLRLGGASRWSAADRHAAFVLHSPNKALGLCGLRGAYVVAPAPEAVDWDVGAWVAALAAAEPSWPLGAHAVAMLETWVEPATQRWLAGARLTLGEWMAGLRLALEQLGFEAEPGVANFLCARPPAGVPDAAALRAHGVAVRDTASFGLPGRWRLSAQPPAAVEALRVALRRG